MGLWAAAATAQTPTADQIELLEALSPSEREALLQRVREGEQKPDQELEFPELIMPTPVEEEEVDGPPVLAGGDTVVIEFEIELDARDKPKIEEEGEIAELLERLRSGNPYRLDESGFLHLPGMPAIYLSGLEVEQAVLRLHAEPTLADIEAFLTLLPLDPVGVDALERFGYDLFEGVPTTFAPATDIPVPADYTIGAGDTINVQLFGNRNERHLLVVNRSGVINFPQIGPISVAGLGFESLRDEIVLRVEEQMIGVRVGVTLGELRSIRIFVLGDVARPGSYTVSGLSTMTNALFVSGGVKEIGSLRKIELKRNGQTISYLDLYDLLLHGDTRGDALLKPGDVIFVPPVGDTVAVDGEMKRPAIYEIRGETTVAEVFAMAGGGWAMANPAAVKLKRVETGKGISVRDIDLAKAGMEIVRDGDVVRVLPNLDQLYESVRLSGNVFEPGLYEWKPGMRISDLLPSTETLKPRSDLHYVLIRREVEPNVLIEVLSADLEAAWEAPDTESNIELAPRDTIHVFNLEVGRQHVVDGLIEEIRIQVESNQPIPITTVYGQVRAPGLYPIEVEMRVSDLIRAGGGLNESAYSIDAELTRYQVVTGEFREVEVVSVDLAGILRGRAAADLEIRPNDHLNIKEIPHWRELATVELVGEVLFPGVYPLRKGEYLSGILERAGGLTQDAFPEGSVFLREDLRERERENIEKQASRIEQDLLSSSLGEENAADWLRIGQAIVEELRNSEPTGRLVIDLNDVLKGNVESDILLKDGDQLFVPESIWEVSVLGEVQHATSHFYQAELNRNEYIRKSGGLTTRADKGRIYIVRANGSVLAESGIKLFKKKVNRVAVLPGDTIVVPLATRRVEPIVFWSSAIQIIYNLSIAAAAINSF